MTLDDATEAVGVLQAAIGALQAAVPSRPGRAGAAFRYVCGDLLAQAPTLIPTAALGAPLRACFGMAVAAGATLDGLFALRGAVLALPIAAAPGYAVAGGCFCHALEAEAKILAGAAFPSSGAAVQALAVFSAGVGAAQDWALDNHLPAQYQALLALGAAVARDLQVRAARLPRVTTYGFGRGTSSIVLAYRLYGDANRADELRSENAAVHPAFMPPSGIALSE